MCHHLGQNNKGDVEMEKKKINMKIADLSSEQQKKLNQVESELACVLVAYENNQNLK